MTRGWTDKSNKNGIWERSGKKMKVRKAQSRGRKQMILSQRIHLYICSTDTTRWWLFHNYQALFYIRNDNASCWIHDGHHTGTSSSGHKDLPLITLLSTNFCCEILEMMKYFPRFHSPQRSCAAPNCPTETTPREHSWAPCKPNALKIYAPTPSMFGCCPVVTYGQLHPEHKMNVAQERSGIKTWRLLRMTPRQFYPPPILITHLLLPHQLLRTSYLEILE